MHAGRETVKVSYCSRQSTMVCTQQGERSSLHSIQLQPTHVSHSKLSDTRTELATDVLKPSHNHGFQLTASNFGNSSIFVTYLRLLICLGLSCWKYRSTPTFMFYDISRHFQRLQNFSDVCFCDIFITFVFLNCYYGALCFWQKNSGKIILKRISKKHYEENMDWTDIYQDLEKLWTLANTVKKISVSIKCWKILAWLRNYCFLTTVFHGVIYR
jgi:hypothetical protein